MKTLYSLRISLFFFLAGSWQLVSQTSHRAQIYLQCFIYTNFYFVPSQNIEYQAEVKKIEVEHQAALEALRRLFQSYPITVFHSLSFMYLLTCPWDWLLEQWPVYRRWIVQNLTDQTQIVSWQSRQELKIFRFVTRGNWSRTLKQNLRREGERFIGMKVAHIVHDHCPQTSQVHSVMLPRRAQGEQEYCVGGNLKQYQWLRVSSCQIWF